MEKVCDGHWADGPLEMVTKELDVCERVLVEAKDRLCGIRLGIYDTGPGERKACLPSRARAFISPVRL
jgi:hypothetical protein